MVECNLAKVDVEGSNPFSRSTRPRLASRARASPSPRVPRCRCCCLKQGRGHYSSAYAHLGGEHADLYDPCSPSAADRNEYPGGMSRSVLVATILALPLAAFAESPDRSAAKTSKKTDANAAAQLAATLGEPNGKPSRAPNLADVKQAKAELPTARTTETLRVADPRHLAASSTRDNQIEKIEKVDKIEAKGARSAYQPAPTGTGSPRGARMDRPHRARLAAFDPGQLRSGTAASAQTNEIARSWKSNLKWDMITIDSYATIKGRSEPDAQKLAQRNADNVRAYLVRQGVPADYLVAVGHADASAPSAKVELSVTTCDDVTIACRKPVAAK